MALEIKFAWEYENAFSGRNMPALRAFFTNVAVKKPFPKKLDLVFRNNRIKIVKTQR